MRAGVSILVLVGLLAIGCGGSDDEGGGAKDDGASATGTTSGDGGNARHFVDRVRPDPISDIERRVRSANRDIRESALRQIPELKDREAAIRLLGEMVEDENPEFRTVVVEQLLSRDAKSVSGRLMLRLGEEEDPNVRAKLVEAVAKLAGPPSVHALIDIAKDWDEAMPVRTRAIFAMGDFGDPIALDTLHELVGDLAPAIRRVAMDALTKIASDRSVDAVGDRVEDDADVGVRVAGVAALTAIVKKTPATKRKVVSYLVRPIVEDEDPAPELLEVAIETLRELTGEHFGYDPMKPVDGNAAAIEGWRSWWEKAKVDYD